jgi:hypothetical protein
MSTPPREPENSKVPTAEAEPFLFGADQDWWHNACVNWSAFPWEGYISGYKEAADIVVNHLGTSRGTLDTVVFPLLFLYRQYLELRLKDLVKRARKLLSRTAPTKKPDHRLLPLWRELREMIEEVWPEEEAQPLQQIEDCLAQFSSVDPGSFAFRYPESKDGKRSLPPGLKHINVRRVAEIMQQASQLLEGIGCALDVYLEHKADMESDAYGG